MNILPFYNERRTSIWTTASNARGISHQENLSLPSSYELMDISKDKKFMAIIDNQFNLQVYRIICDNNVIKPVSHIIQDVKCTIDSYNSLFAFLSVADGTGYVALSFAQLDAKTGLFLESSIDSKYTNCTVYKEVKNGKVKTTTIPCQGRAVFIEDKLAIVGNWELTVLDAKKFRYKYFLDLSELKQSYEGMVGAESLGSNTSWAKNYVKSENQNSSPNRKDGDSLIALTRHIRDNILVTTYRGYITKIWSILDGSLIVSFRTQKDEYIMAISEANQFIATYSDTTKRVKIYCTKSGLPLHEYTPKCMEEEGNNGAVQHVKFDKCKHYLLITGTRDNHLNSHLIKKPADRLKKKSSYQIGSRYIQQSKPKPINQPVKPPRTQQTLFFEVWSISQEKLIVCKKKKITVEARMILPFVIEEFTALSEVQNNEYYNTHFYGVCMTRGEEDDSNLMIERFPLLKQEISKSRNGTLWETYDFSQIGKNFRLRGHFDEMIQPLDNKDMSVTYLIKNDDDRFILRFNLNMVHLWKLEEIKDDVVVEEKEVFDFKPMVEKRQNMQPNTKRGKAPAQAQNQDEEQYQENKRYYNSFEKNTLVYIRAFKGQHYVPLSTFRDDWNLVLERDSGFQPKFSFMEDKGRILVEIGNGTRATVPKIKDELFLQIPDSRQDISITINGSSIASNNIASSSSASISSATIISRPPVVYHEIESASQALHHIYIVLKKKNTELQQLPNHSESLEVGKTLFRKTRELLNRLIFSENATNYFNTASGSKTLAMLASFPPGQAIIFDLTNENTRIPMKIFSYAVEEKKSENLLTVLINESKYDLFQLLFNRMIINYYNEGTGNLSAFIDVLLCLQDEQSAVRLLKCIQSLSYLPVRPNRSALMESEYYRMLADTPADEDESSNLEYCGSFTALEQINKYNYGFPKGLWTFMIFKFRKYCREKEDKKGKPQQATIKNNSKKAQVCLVPLPYFNSYRIFPKRGLIENLTDCHKNSLFTRTALNDSENKIFRQGYTVMEVLVTYKWKAFARDRFIIILLVQVAYYASFSIGVALAEEVFGYVPGNPITHLGQIISLIVALLIGLFLMFQEYRQWKVSRRSYIRSFFNYLDLASFIFPLATFFLLIYNCTGLYEASAISTLILWIHFILRLRVFRTVGYLLEMVIQLSAKIVPVTFVMILVVIAFTHSFFVLLRKRDDLFIEEATDGEDDANNVFGNLFFAFITVWFFIFGVFDPLFDGGLGNYPMALIFAVVFSVIIVLVLFNVVIALMSGKVEEISTTGTKCWIGHYASVVAEIELFWCFLSQRLSKNYNPIYVYYNANRETIEAHHRTMKEETEILQNDLNSRQGDVNEFSFDDDE